MRPSIASVQVSERSGPAVHPIPAVLGRGGEQGWAARWRGGWGHERARHCVEAMSCELPQLLVGS